MFIETFYPQSEMDEKMSLGVFRQPKIRNVKNNLQGNDDLSCSPSRSSKSLTCLLVPWLLKSLSFDQPAQGTVIYVSHSVSLMQFQEIKKNNSVWERSGSILECLTRDQFKRLRVRASPASLFCVLEQDTSILA